MSRHGSGRALSLIYRRLESISSREVGLMFHLGRGGGGVTGRNLKTSTERKTPKASGAGGEPTRSHVLQNRSLHPGPAPTLCSLLLRVSNICSLVLKGGGGACGKTMKELFFFFSVLEKETQNPDGPIHGDRLHQTSGGGGMEENMGKK